MECLSKRDHSLTLARHVQVGDFDLSRVAEPDATASNLTANNPRWLAPEVITSQVRCTRCAPCHPAVMDQHASPRLALVIIGWSRDGSQRGAWQKTH